MTESGAGERHRERGSITIMYAFLTVVFVGLGFVALETWSALGQRAELAELADLSARAGANAVDIDLFYDVGTLQLIPGDATAFARDALNRNDPPERVQGMSADISASPTSVEVVIRGSITFFGGFGTHQIEVNSEAEPRLNE